jgi:predicted acylesterase/phospholipase RssA
VALVCAGGGVTGAVYEIGCLRALEEVLDLRATDMDLYVGVSGGAFVASLLAAGIPVSELYEAVATPGGAAIGGSEPALFRLGARDLAATTRRAPRVLGRALVDLVSGERRSLGDAALALFELLPAGLLDNSGIQELVASVLKRAGRRDRFADLPRPLYVIAVDLDDGEAVAFGDRAHRRVPVSRAVQASTALPGLYRPVRIGGREYVDGGVKKTAHINYAIRKGADLVIVINPIVPLRNEVARGPFGGHLSTRGITWVLDQVLRIVLHGRMQYGMERYRREHPHVDIVLIEPTRDDVRMFSYHIMRASARQVVAEHGYRSTLRRLAEDRPRLRRVFARHGLFLGDPRRAPETPRTAHAAPVGRRLAGTLQALDAALRLAGRRG